MAEPIDEGQDEEFSGVFTDIFPAEWAADPDFCQYLTQLRKVSIDVYSQGTNGVSNAHLLPGVEGCNQNF